jgi:hypothetical protein
MRSSDEYDKDVSNARYSAVHVRGVKRSCELNTINGFHVTKNYSIDLMHTLLEGVVPLELGCVLYCLIAEKRLLTLSELNGRITKFWGVLSVDRQKKPPYLNRLLPPGSGLNPSMKATQCWALLKYLPLIIGDRVPVGDEHYTLLLHLSELVDLAFAPRFTTGMIVYLKKFITDHLNMFHRLFGDRVTIKPKQHFLVHFPTIVRQSGPLIGMSCLKYELKNSFFKRSAHVVCNFKNICKTLAYRHQHFALYSFLCNSHERDFISVGKTTCVPVSSLLNGYVAQLLCDILMIESSDSVIVTYKLSRASTDCRKGHLFVISMDEDEPVLGLAECFICSVETDRWYVVVRICECVGFVAHFHSYMIRDKTPLEYKLLLLSDLLDHHPVYCYEKSINGCRTRFARFPYHVI